MVSYLCVEYDENAGNKGLILAGLQYVVPENINEPRHEISNNEEYATSKGSYQPAHMCSLIRAITSCLNIL